MSHGARTAFLLCAGLGTRLRPLTEQIPKPLVPVFGVPLMLFALGRLAAAGVERVVVNTHHRAEEFGRVFPFWPGAGHFGGMEIIFRHESPVVLDTAGGLLHARDLFLPGPVLVHNGDIFTDLDLAALLNAHAAGGTRATLALRSEGGPLQVGFEAATGRVTDFRGTLGRPEPRFLYTGVSVIDPALLDGVPAGQPWSLVPLWLEELRAGRPLAGVVLDGGTWRDVGDPAAYLALHEDLASGRIQVAPPPGRTSGWLREGPVVDAAAGARLEGWTHGGRGVRVEAGAMLRDCVVWDEAVIAAGADLRRCVVRRGVRVEGCHQGEVL